MKKLQNLLLAILAITLFSCGGSSSSSSTENPFSEVIELLSQIEEKGLIFQQNFGKDVTKEQANEYAEFVKSQTIKLKEEAPKIIGKKVPFSGDPFLLLEIADVVISDADMTSRGFEATINIFCKPKKEITLTAQQNTGSMNKFISDGESMEDATCSIYAMQYVLYLDNAGNVIDSKKFTPFLTGKYDFQYKAGDKLTPSQYCNDSGSSLPMQLSKGNYKDFKEVKFVTQAELNELLKNTK